MTLKANFKYRDHSNEIGSMALIFPEISAGGADYDAVILAMSDVETAITACTLCDEAGYGYTDILAGDLDTIPTSEYAQRELGLRVFLVDDTNGRKSHFTIPGPDLASLTILAGTDMVDLSDAGIMAALVTEVEGECLSQDGNAVSVLRAVIVGRKNQLVTGIARHTPTLTGNNAVRLIVADVALLPDLGDAITQLTNDYQWLEVGDPVSDIVTAVSQTVTQYYNLMLVGLVSQFLITIPPGWLQLDGSTYSADDYPILWERLPSQLKTGTDFTLPDLTDVYPYGATDDTEIGDSGGLNSYQLSIAQLPAHTHTYIPPTLGITIGNVGPPVPAVNLGAPIPTGGTGSGTSIDNRPAFVEMLFAVYAGQE